MCRLVMDCRHYYEVGLKKGVRLVRIAGTRLMCDHDINVI